MVIVFLGMGSNLGNRLAMLQGGRERLSVTPGIVCEQSSSLYETAAEGCPPGSPAFLNAVLKVRTSLSARQLLERCQAIEDELGRSRPGQNAPRTLDLDLLFYGTKVIEEPGLQVPHPRLHRRAFVLLPLLEMAAGFEHPVLRRSMKRLAADLPANVEVVPLQRKW